MYALSTKALFFLNFTEPIEIEKAWRSSYFDFVWNAQLHAALLRRRALRFGVGDNHCSNNQRCPYTAAHCDAGAPCHFPRTPQGVTEFDSNFDMLLSARSAAERCFVRAQLNALGLMQVDVRRAFGLILRALFSKR